MNKWKDGIISLNNNVIISPGYRFEDFKKTLYYNGQDGIKIIYLDSRVIIDKHEYIISLFFRNSVLYMLSLICCDIDFSIEQERERKCMMKYYKNIIFIKMIYLIGEKLCQNMMQKVMLVALIFIISLHKDTNQSTTSKQGNRRLQATIYFLAIQMVQISSKGTPRNPAFRTYFERRTAEGKNGKQILICISRRLINIIYGMLKSGTEYRMPEVKSEDNEESLK